MAIYTLCITWISMLFVTTYSYKRKEFMNPAFLFTFPLFISYNIFYFVFSKIYLISTMTLLVFACGLIFFNIGYFFLMLFLNIAGCKSNKILKKQRRKSNRLFLLLCICIGLVSVLVTFRYMMSLGLNIHNYSASLTANLREEYISNAAETPFLVTYGKYFLFFSVYVYWYEYLNKINPINKLIMYFLLLCCLAVPFLTLSRTDLLIFILPIMFIYFRSAKIESKFKKTQIFARYNYLKFLLLISILVLIMGTLRDGINQQSTSFLDPNSYLIGYLGYELIAFDRWVVPYPRAGSGFLSFEPIKKILTLIQPAKSEISLAPKGQFNVYSYLKAPYLDHGTIGVIVIMFLIGLLCGYIYYKSWTGNEYWEIFYATYTYGIAMAFFDWQFTIVTFIYLVIFLLGVGSLNISIFQRKQGVYHGSG